MGWIFDRRSVNLLEVSPNLREQARDCPAGQRRDERGRCIEESRAPQKEAVRSGPRNLGDMNPADMTKGEALRELYDSGCNNRSVHQMSREASKRLNIYRCDALQRKAG